MKGYHDLLQRRWQQGRRMTNTESALETTKHLSEIGIGVGTRNVLMEEVGDQLGRD
jgi:hypothetical protein